MVSSSVVIKDTFFFRVKMKLAETEKLCFGVDSMRHIWLHGIILDLCHCQPCWGHAVPSCRSSMKTLNRAEARTNPWPTPLAIGLWLVLPSGFGHSGSFQSTSRVIQPPCGFISLPVRIVMGDSIESLSEGKVNNIHCSLNQWERENFRKVFV